MSLRVKGPRQHASLSDYVAKRSDGVFIKSKARSANAYKVPVVGKWGYLGAVISYNNFEKETLDRRLQAAELAYLR